MTFVPVEDSVLYARYMYSTMVQIKDGQLASQGQYQVCSLFALPHMTAKV